nr:hypothetical protein B0A51_07824 [Rachicladosporium sp. CCFEE 5018]
MAQISQTSHLLSLPAELIFHILAYLEPLDLANVALTDRRLKTQSYDDQIWLPIINENLPERLTSPQPLETFRELYIAHHSHWFLPKHKIWFSDSEPNGKLLIARYDPRRACIEAYTMAAMRGEHTLERWEKDPDVIIHSFNPVVALDLNQPTLRLSVDSMRTDDQPNAFPSDRGYAASTRYSKETLMETFAEAGLYGSFMLCRNLPAEAIGNSTSIWPPRRFPANARVRNDSQNGYKSAGHRPTTLAEVSQHNFRLRKWVEYTGRRSTPSIMSFTAQNGLTAALGLAGQYISGGMGFSSCSYLNSGMNVRMPEDITTYATLPEWCYTPTKEKPWRGIWCGDYSGHGCEFILIMQPDKEDEAPLPENMEWLQNWFRGYRRRSSASTNSASTSTSLPDPDPDFEFAVARQQEVAAAFEAEYGDPEPEPDGPFVRTKQPVTDYKDVPTGRLEAVKLTGDMNIPRGEYTFIAPEVGHGGFMRVADEETFKGARVVRSAGHIAGRGFNDDQYMPSQLIMISHDRLAQYWEGFGEGFGHISYYQRVDLDALLKI